MTTNREDVLAMIYETVTAFTRLGTKRSPIHIELRSFNRPVEAKGFRQKIFVSIGLEFIGHFTIKEGETTTILEDMVKHFKLTNVMYDHEKFFKQQLELEIPEDRFLLDNCCYNENIKHINKFVNRNARAKIDEEYVKGEIGDMVPFGTMVLKTEKELLKEYVEIYKEEPYTNSVAMVRDFRVNQKILNRTLTELLVESPSLINSVDWGVYKIGNDYNKYMHIEEKMFMALLSKLPSSPNRITNILRRHKLKEYNEAFINMKRWVFDNGYNETFTKAIMKERKEGTSELILLLNSVLYDQGDNAKVLKQAVFNNINFKVGIDAMSFNASDINRETKGDETQKLIIRLEKVVINILRGLGQYSLSSKQTISTLNYVLYKRSMDDLFNIPVGKELTMLYGLPNEEFFHIINDFAYLNPYTPTDDNY